jgi:hypothetical protein
MKKLIVSILVLGSLAAPVASYLANGSDAQAAQFARDGLSVPSVTVEREPIVLDEIVIRATEKASPRARTAPPCVEREEGWRALEQGRGAVRSYTFCD